MKIKDIKKYSGIAFCLIAAITAFNSELESQKKEKKIEEMESRLTKLEEKEES